MDISKKTKLKPTIGLEIHIELRTKSKMFCACSADHFGKKANSLTCPVCLGLPGALPVPNKKAIEWTILFGKALNSRINHYSKFDRKHYFYPDLPKGYQISQYDIPFCEGGYVKVGDKNINITRVHLEEDTGKLQHKKIKDKEVSLVDFNRSGVPLMEIVTEPDIESADQAKQFAKKIRRIARYLDISDCDMEKGSMRLEANVSWGIDLGYKVEVKNLNSFNYLKKAIEYELERQNKLIAKGEMPIQETRGWDENKNITVSQRVKETSADYRYFPEPDIPPIHFTKTYIEELSAKMPNLPDDYENILIEFNVPEQFIDIILEDIHLAEYTIKEIKYSKKQNEKLSPQVIVEEIINKKLQPQKAIVGKVTKDILSKKQSIIKNEGELEDLVEKAIQQNKKAVSDYKSGKIQAISALMGTVMAISKGKADPKKTIQLLKDRLK
ncbi:Asp-tRNA(Asn)/Glu-tRNA(Gln) amidotransferase subunit GatB [Candidatus Woesebacteria bacterium]|nr:Asp-tRNA(Asn)/Glu-tRNA(Gln) amidotransferase subunit GatB [Candidatus Woesebacteria bacterium]